ncbi:hypothetical protein HMY34_15810 [Thiothrix subterranea]|uniref:pilus assembly PilX family protein n=1 Tax=Thiothrix subterranea TaxID=2735563 RepID=UPI00192AD1AE|nr:PilX N-terminal domain-containing pilus assembly protein [Thiothrix subterranea]QQZ30109.1 hypothetical protein HMY34_15810 [Thiothrix subterranea]
MQAIKNKQQGAVLMWGMVILLTMTVIGIAATRMATVDSRIAGNQMTTMLTFQGTDSMLRDSIDLYHVVKTATNGTKPEEGNSKNTEKELPLPLKTYKYDLDDPNDVGVEVNGEMDMSAEDGCPPLRGIAMTTEMTPDVGGIACRIFTAHTEASLAGTGAKSLHSEGALKPVPKIN